jgi:nitrate reductase NapD
MTAHHTAIDRRALITGRLLNPDRVVAPPGGEIASILVQARPERLADVATAIVALAGCEIFGRDPKGKLVVVVDAPDAGTLGSTLNTIALLPDVYSASLVFHALDAASA